MRLIPTLLAGALLTAGCATTSVGSSSAPSNAIAVTVGSCHAGSDHGQPLPDPRCTPGAVNPAVTQADIATTICRSGWSTQQRQRYLPESLSSRFKRQVEDAYGMPHSTDAEGDHLISIELGGVPGPMPGVDFTRNFWPEKNDHPSPRYLNSKDRVENDLHAAVCSGRVPLAAAQAAITSDWTTAEQRLGIG
jgi:hypothetical protein